MNILLGSAITGAATLASAFALQKLYEKTNFYPPTPVFWFFIGVTAHLGLLASKKAVGASSFGGLSGFRGLSGFGESVENLDKMIDTYQKHIADLKKILTVGSAAGRAAAQGKINDEQKVLNDLLARREDLLED